jgi:hypothetical protein
MLLFTVDSVRGEPTYLNLCYTPVILPEWSKGFTSRMEFALLSSSPTEDKFIFAPYEAPFEH